MLINEYLENGAQSTPEKVAIVCSGMRITYEEINKSANIFRDLLIANNYRKLDRSAILLDNSLESVVSIFGVLKAGGVFVILDPAVKTNKLKHILEDCQARVLITTKKHLPGDLDLSKLPNLKSVAYIDYAGPLKLGSIIRQPQMRQNPTVLDVKTTKVFSEIIDVDLAGLIYTSGSSGLPKGVMLTHQNMDSAATSVIQYLENTSNDIIIDTLPLAFSYGLYQVLTAFKVGGTVILEKGFVYPQEIVNKVIKEKVTGWPMVPTIVSILLKMPNLKKYNFNNLRYISSASQALPAKHLEQLIATFPNAKIFSMYGLTECKRVTFLPPEESSKRPSSVGKAMPNTEAYIVDDNGNEIFEPSIAGELVVRGSNVMKGYWNLPLETQKALRPGRYPGDTVLYTGDVFEKDKEGFLYFLGRKDDLIKTGGHRVSPRELEDLLYQREDVAEASVIGVNDETLGQAIKAFIHLNDGAKTTAEDIICYCSERIERFAVPKYIVFCKDLPKNSNGKIDKQALRETI